MKTYKTNEELQKSVQHALIWQRNLEPSHIGVTVQDGVVTLSGTVSSYAQKQAAEKAAKNVSGVRAVAQDIVVRLPDPGHPSDQEITQAILQAFKWHWDIPESRIHVKVEGGVVTLEGEVSWNYERESARSAVSQLLGVKAIRNDVIVRPHAGKAERQDIESALWRDPDIDDEDIDVSVEGNTVYLTGTVGSWHQKEEAGRIAWSAAGVGHVDNQLLVDNTAD